MEIENKNILITGSAVRIGKDIAKYLAHKGAKIFIHYNTSKTEAYKLYRELSDISTGHHIERGDITDTKYLEALSNSLQKIDVLINNASLFKDTPFYNEDIETSKEIFEVNFWAPYRLMQSFYKQKLSSKKALVINILDSLTEKTTSQDGSYKFSKKCLKELTKTAALQFAPTIRVNGIAPGYVYPPEKFKNSKMKKSIKRTPLKKPISGNDIAHSCSYLIENDSITGEIISLDGGVRLN